jgi:hypothetical protein
MFLSDVNHFVTTAGDKGNFVLGEHSYCRASEFALLSYGFYGMGLEQCRSFEVI